MKEQVRHLLLYKLICDVSAEQDKQLIIHDRVYPRLNCITPMEVRHIEKLLYSWKFYG